MPDSEFTKGSVGAATAAWMGFFIGPNALLAATQGLFMQPVAAAFGLNRTSISAVMLISPWTAAVCAPLAGRAMDRWGLRRVLLPGIAMFGLMHFLMSRADSTGQLMLVTVLLAGAAGFHSAVGYAKVVSLWFARNRGFVLGIVAALGTGVSSAAVPQVLRLVIRDHGWRGGYVSLAALILLVGLPTVSFLLREPVAAASNPGAAAPAALLPGLSAMQAMRRPAFWLLFGAILFASMALIGTVVHAFPMLTERGFSAAVATTALSFMFIGSVIGQLGSGYLVDRIDTPRTALPFFIAALFGVLIVHSAAYTPSLLIGSLLLGIGTGAENGLAAYLTSRYFGLRGFGHIFGFMLAAANLGIGVGLMLMGIAHDLAGDYGPMRGVFGAAMVLAVVCMALLGPYVYSSSADAQNALLTTPPSTRSAAP
jgi:MFS family permease